MDKIKLFESSLEMISELKEEIICSDVVDCGPRLELVEQCIYISFDHGIGVNNLLAFNLPIQAMVLLRAQFESVVRAYWLFFLASENQVSKLNFSNTFEEQFISDTCPGLTEMLDKLSKANLPAKPVIDHLCDFKKYHLKQLNSFVHTGKQSFTRGIMGVKDEMQIILMKQSNNLVTAAAQIMLTLTVPDKQKFIHYLHEKYRNCFYLDQDVDPEIRARVEKYYTDGHLK
ncbi:hypothetical protein [Acinetobacter sp. NyZ410]|uniref:DUF6988 family protein n=1 Tax=Acinetobacter sp. NyZ410 TaxID=2929509 RepID=UPI001FBA5372|nr:hypothetical protein [Acinetobacter sp. NyZ410]UOH20456.1 hypothetical protein MTO68_10000 [Acinetobacter sp. NyZ410]